MNDPDTAMANPLDKVNVIYRMKSILPGLFFSALIGALALALSSILNIPVMLLAIVAGLLFHKLSMQPVLQSGINWASRSLLYIGVALIGLRIDIADILLTGWSAPIAVIGILMATLLAGYYISRLLRQSKSFSLLIASAVSICGVSAAVAICSVMEDNERRNGELAITIAGITVLSTTAMMLYPFISIVLNLGSLSAGIFMGGSIHNVSQAVGAGYAVSQEAGDITVLLKLIRVSTLLPIILAISYMGKTNTIGEQHGLGLKFFSYFPPFLLTFLVLAILSCLSLIPELVTQIGNTIAELFLIISLVAIGAKTDLKQITSVGPKPLLAMTLTTIFMAALSLVVGLVLVLWLQS